MKTFKQKIKKAIEIVLNSEIIIDDDEEIIKIDENYQKLLEKITIRVVDELKNAEIEDQREIHYSIEKSICEKWDNIKKVEVKYNCKE